MSSNLIRRRSISRRTSTPSTCGTPPTEVEPEPEEAAPLEGADEHHAEVDLQQPELAVVERVLVAQVPRAESRWGQVGLNEAVVDRFFRVVPNSSQRLRLRHIRANGDVGGTEIRAIRMSEVNRNRRLEIGAAHRLSYPRNGAPILVFANAAFGSTTTCSYSRASPVTLS